MVGRCLRPTVRGSATTRGVDGPDDDFGLAKRILDESHQFPAARTVRSVFRLEDRHLFGSRRDAERCVFRLEDGHLLGTQRGALQIKLIKRSTLPAMCRR